MKRDLHKVLNAAALALCLTACIHDCLHAQEAAIRPERLRCERRSEPLGVDEPRPLLSWIVSSDTRDQSQSAYQILVASSVQELQKDVGDVWDSSKQPGDDPLNVSYQGPPLASGQKCYWKVRLWDGEDRASRWSEPATWQMGLLAKDDWHAEWIGFDKLRQRAAPAAPLEGANWIGRDAEDAREAGPGSTLFVATATLPEDARVVSAEAYVVADDRVWLAVNGQMVIHGEAGWERVKPVSLVGHLRPGANELRFRVENESAGPTGLLAKIVITLDDGTTATLASDGSWQASSQVRHHWPSEPLDDISFSSSVVLGDYGAQPWGRLTLQPLFLPPPSQLRCDFVADKPVTAATLHVAALGACDAHLNGRRVSDDLFTPGWTDYRRRVYYRSYDVTKRIRPGLNALGAVLADGWYSGYVGWGQNRDHYGKHPRARLQLHLQFADGSSQIVATGPDWKAAVGPTQHADFLMGETYDARLEQAGWDEPGFDAAGWDSVDVGAEVAPEMQSHPGPAVGVIREFPPVSVTEPVAGKYVFDLGQNFAGFARLKVRGKPGQRITLRFAERLADDGTIYTTNLRDAKATDVYICRGGGVETWAPRFTFHGFQYVEIAGLDAPPGEDAITGLALSSVSPRASQFECSSDALNRLYSNIYWTQRANFIDVPTDCPQRDERLGWTGDAQVYIATACLNADVEAFFAKWLIDLADAQRDDGQFPMVAPLIVAGDDGGPAWADAGVICPVTAYEFYGNRRQLERSYDSMKRYVEFMRGRSTSELLPPAEFHCFGDWLSVDAETPHDVIYTAYFAQSARLLAQAARALGRVNDATDYQELYQQIRRSFAKAYVDSEGRIQGDTQCCYVLALAFDLLEDPQRQQAAARLVERIAARDDHLSTGFIGTKDLMLVLAKIGRNDVAHRLIGNETYPSWGFSIKHGATSIWERWDGWTPERGFQDAGMNSFAHYSFGAVYQWMAENIGGIQRLTPAYQEILIAPQPGELTWARTAYDSVRGPISTAWQRRDGAFQLDVEIPANTTAVVKLPASKLESVYEGDRPASTAAGVHAAQIVDGQVELRVGSGVYSFTTEARP
ncbi:MAG: rhamnosidase [Planctomycetaceae bacterium]|nr:rhamnosidase [Planctomycetaceae bacterium]